MRLSGNRHVGSNPTASAIMDSVEPVKREQLSSFYYLIYILFRNDFLTFDRFIVTFIITVHELKHQI